MYLSLALNTMRPGVTLAPEAGGSSIDQLFDLSSSDYALVVSIRRYSPEIRRTLDFLADSNIPCTLLTDVSPLAEPTNGTHVIQAHIGSTSVLESFTALISVSHALLSLVQRFIPESRKRLDAAEQAWRRFNKNG
jgi:DNA-binding MurR/RpiR family transcriptional regulator